MQKLVSFLSFYLIVTFSSYAQDSDSKLGPVGTRKNVFKSDFLRSFLYKINLEYERFLVPQISAGAVYSLYHSSYGSPKIELLGHKKELFVRFYTTTKKEARPYFQLSGGMIRYQKEYDDQYNIYRIEQDGSHWLYKIEHRIYKEKSNTYSIGITSGVHKLLGEKKRLSLDVQYGFQIAGYPFHPEKTVDVYDHIDYIGNVSYTIIEETPRPEGKDKFKWYSAQAGASMVSSLKLGYAF